MVVLAALSGAASSALAAAPPSAALGAQRARVFFSGHSLLDNPLPDWIETIAVSRGDSLGWQEQIVLGSPIRVRSKGDDPNASGFPGYQLGKSKSGGGIDVLRELDNPTQLAPGEQYNRLLITERTDLFGTLKWEDTVGYLRHYHDRLVENAAEAGSLLYQVWPEIEKSDPMAWVGYVRGELFGWECVAAKVNQTLQADGRADRVDVIPGGIALAELVERALAGGVPGVVGTSEQRIDAVFADDVHLTPLGIYLMAAVQYAALFGKSPVGAAGAPGVNPAAVPVLQQIAWDTVSSYLSSRRTPALSACRARVASELCPAYHRFRGDPEQVAGCGFWTTSDSPFAGLDPVPTPALPSWGAAFAALLLAGSSYRSYHCRRP